MLYLNVLPATELLHLPNMSVSYVQNENCIFEVTKSHHFTYLMQLLLIYKILTELLFANASLPFPSKRSPSYTIERKSTLIAVINSAYCSPASCRLELGFFAKKLLCPIFNTNAI